MGGGEGVVQQAAPRVDARREGCTQQGPDRQDRVSCGSRLGGRATVAMRVVGPRADKDLLLVEAVSLVRAVVAVGAVVERHGLPVIGGRLDRKGGVEGRGGERG